MDRDDGIGYAQPVQRERHDFGPVQGEAVGLGQPPLAIANRLRGREAHDPHSLGVAGSHVELDLLEDHLRVLILEEAPAELEVNVKGAPHVGRGRQGTRLA